MSRHKHLRGISSARARACSVEARTRPLHFGDSEFMIIDVGWSVPVGLCLSVLGQ